MGQPNRKNPKKSKKKTSKGNSSGGSVVRPEWFIVVATLLCDFNSWGHQFVVDDHRQIVENAIIHHPTRILEIFTSPYDSVFAAFLFRPLTTLSFAVNYWISGASPDSFHLVNRLLHILICLGIFWLLRRLIPTPPMIPLLTSLLFAVHPIQTEAITYINGRADALAMLFFIFAWFYFIKNRQAPSHQRKAYVISVLLYLFALLSKESAITWLGIVLLTELTFFSQSNVKTFFHRLRRDFVQVYAGYLVVTLAYLATRQVVLGGNLPNLKLSQSFVNNPLATAAVPERILTALHVSFQNMLLLLWPLHLSSDYSFNQIPLLTRWSSPTAVGILFLTVVFLVALVWSYKRSPHIFFGLGYFVITYSIVSNIILPIGVIRGDRLIYIPLLGYCLVAATGLTQIDLVLEKSSWKKVFRGVIIVVLALLAIRTVARNESWSDEFTLSLQDVSVSPNSVRLHNDLGSRYYSRNQLDRALEHFRTAESIHPEFVTVLNNMGALLVQQGKLDEAVTYFNRAVAGASAGPDQATFRHNLAVAFQRKGDFTRAIEQYDILIQQNPSDALAHFSKGKALFAQGRTEEAIAEYSRAVELDPEFEAAKSDLNMLKGESSPQKGISK